MDDPSGQDGAGRRTEPGATRRRRLEHFEVFFEHAPDAVYLYDMKGLFVDGNLAAEEMIGVARDEIIGHSLFELDLLTAAQLPRALAALARNVAGMPAGPDEFSIRRADGSTMPVEIRTRPVTIGGRRLVLGIARDIRRHKITQGQLREEAAELDRLVQERTAELQAANEQLEARVEEGQRIQAQLRQSTEKYRAVVDQSADLVYLVDLETMTLMEGNQSLKSVLGYTDEELTSLRLYDFLDVSPDEIDQNVATILERGSLYVGQRQYSCKDGTTISVEVNVAHIQFLDRDVLAVVARDQRERQALEDQLRQSQKMEAIGTLAGGVAHDFNNLLCVIAGRAEMARQDLSRSHPVRDDIDEIVEAADRAADLTRQLLAFSRRQVLKPRVIDLNRVVHGMDKMLHRLLGANVALEAELDPALGLILSDVGQTEQVLMNLVVNAREALPHGGTITIRTQAQSDGAEARLQVVDDGVGIEPELLDSIFEPFMTTKDSGTGLGLSTVHGIVLQSGGRIDVESKPGKGTTFTVTFDVVDEDEDQDDTGQPPVTEPRAARPGQCVLVVEDDPMMRRLVTHILENAGYAVRTVDSGEAALGLLDESDAAGLCDLLLTDLVLPSMTGRELAEQLTSVVPGLRVLFMSGYTEDAVFLASISSQGPALLAKPFTPAELRTRVHKALNDDDDWAGWSPDRMP